MLPRSRLWLAVLVALFAAIVPFAILGAAFEEDLRTWFQQSWSPAARFWLVVLLLSSDILLPVPSSAVSTYAGAQLGFLPAWIASSLGMTVGASLGYWLARWAGAPLVRRLSSEEDRARLQPRAERSFPWLLIVTRPAPILAEAAVLLAGLMRVSWWTFLWPVLLTNACLSAIYAALGHWSLRAGWLGPMIGISILIPVIVTWLARRGMRNGQIAEQPDPRADGR